MALLAAFELLLFRHTGQPDMVVGLPIANRNRRETEGVIGFFLNTLALRADLSANPRVSELLDRVRDATIGAYQHQELPFEKLVAELQPERDLSRTPLFQVMFVFVHAVADPEMPNLVLEPLDVEAGAAHFDLTLSLARHGEPRRSALGELSGGIEYDRELFDATTIGRFAGHFTALLEDFIAHPDKRLTEVSLLSAAELHALRVEWNDTAADRPQVCLHQLFEARAAAAPEAIAIEHGDERWSYGELDGRANQLAHRLCERGLEPGDTVGICLGRGPETVAAILAVLKAGGAYLPLDPEYPAERLAAMIAGGRISALVTEERHAARLASPAASLLLVDRDRGAIANASRAACGAAVGPDHPAYVMFTSGSTGRPKGIPIGHRAAAGYTATAAARYGLRPGDRVLQFASISFDLSVEEIFATLAGGAALVSSTPEMRLSAARFLERCAAWQVSVLSLPTAFWHQLVPEVAAGAAALPAALRLVCLGGEGALAEQAAAWRSAAGPRIELLNTYGPTEATVVATMYRVADEAGSDAAVLPLGRPIDNVRAHVLDRAWTVLPLGAAGELCLAGEGLSGGYLDQPGMTAERFVPDPWGARPGGRLYRTGDRARRRADGTLPVPRTPGPPGQVPRFPRRAGGDRVDPAVASAGG